MADKRISQLVDRGTVVNNDVIPIVVSGATTTNKATISSIQTFMQGNLDVGVTSVGITLGSTGTDVNVSGSPVTSSGNITINIPSASATNRGLVTTGSQTFAGAKTFNSDLIVNGITVGKGGASNGNNTAIGANSLSSNTTGTLNTATGISSLQYNTGGNSNTANGANSLVANTTGGFNTASGNQSLYSNTTGQANTAIGLNSLYSNTTGTYNIGVGSGAGYYIADGSTPNTTSDFSIYLGADTKASIDGAQNEVVIGYNAIGNGSNTVTIGNSSNTENYFTGNVRGLSFQVAAAGTANPIIIRNTSGTSSTTSNTNVIGFNSVNNIFVTTHSRGGFILGFNNSVSNREYTLPDASGTVALTSNLSAYLPLAGGTLTGALNGTSAVFSSTVSATQYTATSTAGSGLRVYGGSGTNQWDIYLNSTNLRFSDNTGTGSIVFDRPLNGTSASFSGNGSSFGSAASGSYPITIQTNVSEQSAKFIGKNNNNNIQFFDSAGTTYQAVLGTIGNSFIVGTGTSGTTRLTIDSAGAATFSGALNGTSATFSGVVTTNGSSSFSGYGLTTKGTYGLYVQRGSTNDSGVEVYHDGTNAIINSTYQSTGSFGGMLLYTGGSPRLTIASTGAATFSSSVTALDIYAKQATGGYVSLRNGGSGASGYVEFIKNDGTTRLGYLGYSTTNVEMTLENSAKFIVTGGSVGIGTASPKGKFDVFRAAGDSGTAAIVISNGEGGGGRNWSLNTEVVTAGDFAICQSTTNGGTPSPTGANTKFYITSSGNSVIGGTTAGTSLNTSVTVNNPTAGNYSGLIAMTADTQRGYYGGTSTGLEIGVAGSGFLGIYTSGTERMRITSDGYLRMAASTGGIQFNGDTAAANALDDYEEGTWTPVVGGTTGNPTVSYFTQLGKYVKIGRVVHIFCQLRLTSSSGGSGNLIITGLPFTISGDSDETGGSIGLALGFATLPTVIQPEASTSYVFVMVNESNTPITDLDFTYFNFTITYLVNT